MLFFKPKGHCRPLNLQLFLILSMCQLIVALPNSVSFGMYLDRVQNRNKDSVCLFLLLQLLRWISFSKDMTDSNGVIFVG